MHKLAPDYGRITFANFLRRLLGTPSEDSWPGVTPYPDFKSSFPKWVREGRSALCSNLDEQGLDLLEMMLLYDPATRISAKQACNHPYFEDHPRLQHQHHQYTNGFH